VTAIDWAPNTNRIVSCSQDRNAYCFVQEEGRWHPTLVILRINRAATCVRWSPKEDKFAVASGSKVVSVCYYEEDANWWVSRHIKKHRSTVLTVAWHPNNLLLATGASDFRARVFSAAIKGVDKSPKSEVFSNKSVSVFGECVAEFDQCQGWVHAVAWSPSGKLLCFAGHDARIAFADVTSDPPTVETLTLPTLPLTALLFVNESTVVGAGHDCNPQLFVHQNDAWTAGPRLDKAEVAAAAAGPDAKKKFENLVKTGQETSVTALNTKHQNTIKSIVPFAGSSGNYTAVSTSGIDGRLIIWPVHA